MKYLISFLIAAAVLKADIEFSGFLITSKESLYSLSDTERRTTSGWLKVGQAFQGYTVEAFDREKEVITLRKSDQKFLVSLRSPRVQNGKETISGSITVGSERIDGISASLFLGKRRRFQLRME